MLRKGEWLEFQVSNKEQGNNLEDICKSMLHISGRMIQKLTRENGLQVNGKKSFLAYQVKTGDRVQVKVFKKENYGVEPENIPLDILYEDEHLLVINKPYGLAVHPTEAHHKKTLANAIAYYYQTIGLQAKVNHVHRLDKDTSGAILIAKHSLAHSILDEQLRNREIKREYYAIVSGIPANLSDTIDLPIGRDRHHATRRRVSPSGDQAVTHYEVIESFSEAALLKLRLDTGRTHQIRVHLSYIGHPVYGDYLYGGPLKGIKRQALHAAKISFYHPFTGEVIEVIAPLPEDMNNLITSLLCYNDKKNKFGD